MAQPNLDSNVVVRTTTAPRDPQTPVGSAGTGAVANAISNSATSIIVATNPELAIVAPAIGAVIGGVLSGVGNASRTRLAKDDSGVWGFLAQVFRFLG